MKRLTICACAGAGLILAAIAWCLAAAPGALGMISADMLRRSAGVALLGFVLIAAGMVFRAALKADRKPAVVTNPLHTSEYRRGFVDSVARAPVPGIAVRSLRRAVLDHRERPIPATRTRIPIADIRRLHELLDR